MVDEGNYEELKGGYGCKYDVRPAVAKIAANTEADAAWGELWEELHHQGSVGEASYAAIVMLAEIYYGGDFKPDWNLFTLAAVIELERFRKDNPPVPEWLATSYKNAWQKLAELSLRALTDGVNNCFTRRHIIAVLALAAGDLKLGAILLHADIDELVEQRMAWTTIYREP